MQSRYLEDDSVQHCCHGLNDIRRHEIVHVHVLYQMILGIHFPHICHLPIIGRCVLLLDYCKVILCRQVLDLFQSLLCILLMDLEVSPPVQSSSRLIQDSPTIRVQSVRISDAKRMSIDDIISH